MRRFDADGNFLSNGEKIPAVMGGWEYRVVYPYPFQKAIEDGVSIERSHLDLLKWQAKNRWMPDRCYLAETGVLGNQYGAKVFGSEEEAVFFAKQIADIEWRIETDQKVIDGAYAQ